MVPISKPEIVIATKNPGKLREFRELFAGCPIEVNSLLELSLNISILEDGETFLENARKKAREVYRSTGKVTIADDSGLEVEALHGLPGIHSARFAGHSATDQENIERLLRMMESVPLERRGAKFVCALVAIMPDGEELEIIETCEGTILPKPRGEGGFGYDPVFYLPELGSTMAEISLETKNRVSHRGKALRKMRRRLKDWYKCMDIIR